MKKNYILRNDLAIQNKKYKKINKYLINNIEVEQYGYKDFSFADIIFNNLESNSNKNDLKQALKKEIKYFLKKYNLNNKTSCLVVGLGNKNVISDALGTQVCNNIVATGYFGFLNINNYRDVYVYIPGTTKESGMEAFKGVNALVKELKPDFLIIVDSLVCSHIRYLNSVIQVTDMGITPGSGLANYNEEISLNTLGVPMFVVGVATATFASTIIRDVMNVKKSHISFKDGYDFLVVSHNIDILIKNLSKVISESINEVLNNFKTF